MKSTARPIVIAITACLLATPASAEDVLRKFRLAVQFGGHNPQDEVKNESANALSIADSTGAIYDQFLDPRDDAAALGTLEVQSGDLIAMSLQYAPTSFFLVEASLGYEEATVGDVEVHELTTSTIRRIPVGDLTRLPLQVTGILRFRPTKTFHPYVGAGIGYSFFGFDPDPEFDQLSLNADRSEGSIGFVSSVNGGASVNFCSSCETVLLSGAVVSFEDSFEWHIAAGGEYHFGRGWSGFVDLRYVFASNSFAVEFNGGDPIGIPIPNRTVDRFPTQDELPGPLFIMEGGLLDLDGDGEPDTGQYYLQDGRFDYDGPTLQFGVRYTF